MTALLVAVSVLLALTGGLVLLLRRVRADHDAAIAEHWRRNGRERPPRGWGTLPAAPAGGAGSGLPRSSGGQRRRGSSGWPGSPPPTVPGQGPPQFQCPRCGAELGSAGRCPACGAGPREAPGSWSES